MSASLGDVRVIIMWPASNGWTLSIWEPSLRRHVVDTLTMTYEALRAEIHKADKKAVVGVVDKTWPSCAACTADPRYQHP